MSDKMIEAWAKEEKARIDRFVVWYRQQREENSKQEWPLKMPIGEWDEQYQMFDDPTFDQQDS